MNRVMLVFIVAASLAIPFPHVLHAQEAEAPTYKEGDWWRAKVTNKRAPGVSVSKRCFEAYPEYVVKILGGQPKIFGARPLLEGERVEPIDCPIIHLMVLGKFVVPGQQAMSREYLKFPMRVGSAWSARFWWTLVGLSGQWVDAQYDVRSWEKVKSPAGEWNAFKIVMYIPGSPVATPGSFTARETTYYYSPEVKAIVQFREESPPKDPDAWGTSALVDFKVSR